MPRRPHPPSDGPRARRQIYVETLVRLAGEDGVEAVWHLTQDPLLHPRWDLRFTHITPEPTATGTAATGTAATGTAATGTAATGTAARGTTDGEVAPTPGHQRFRYEIRAPGALGRRWALRGWGTSVGHRRDDDGHGTSALRFHPDDALSPLGPGSGYWRYVPTDGGVRFLTGYDYQPGWGRLGVALDPVVVRPLVGWATAWSFDRLRLWAERGLDPSRSRDAAVALTATRLAGVAAGALLVARGVRDLIGRDGGAAGRVGAAGSVGSVGSVLGGLVLVAAAAGAPTPSTVPSARRTLRHPPDRRAARVPRSLATLAAPRTIPHAPAPPTDHQGAPA